MQIQNRKARYLYELFEKWEAGICLKGPEVKAILAGKASLGEAYVKIEANEIWIYGLHITCEPSMFSTPDPTRPRKLLLHRREIDKLAKAVDQKGFTLVPLSIYPNEKGKLKISISIAKGKTSYDKRETIKERDLRRDKDG